MSSKIRLVWKQKIFNSTHNYTSDEGSGVQQDMRRRDEVKKAKAEGVVIWAHLIEQVSKIGTREAWGARSNGLELNLRVQLLVLGMHLQDVHPALHVWHIHTSPTLATRL